jgi:hypothetical protein
MDGIIPTQAGDVLILIRVAAGGGCAVGIISRDGEQDLRARLSLKYVNGRSAAQSEARLLVVPGRRVFVKSMNTNEWDEIPN